MIVLYCSKLSFILVDSFTMFFRRALNTRIVTLRMEPYADFAILTPFGRRVQKGLKLRCWFLQPDAGHLFLLF